MKRKLACLTATVFFPLFSFSFFIMSNGSQFGYWLWDVACLSVALGSSISIVIIARQRGWYAASVITAMWAVTILVGLKDLGVGEVNEATNWPILSLISVTSTNFALFKKK